MQIQIVSDEFTLSQQAAAVLLAQVQRQPQSVLVLPTGATPLGTYAELARLAQAGAADFRGVRVFALDEWGGLPRIHPASCHTALWEQVARPLGLAPENFHSLDGAASDPDAECRRYAAALVAAGRPSLALVGLGVNGHVGFNEPAETLPGAAAVTQLAPATAARLRPALNGAPPPTYGLTLSLVDVMHADQVLLLASGPHKAEPVRQMLSGPLTPRCPASLLRLHPHALALLDEAAAAQLPGREAAP